MMLINSVAGLKFVIEAHRFKYNRLPECSILVYRFNESLYSARCLEFGWSSNGFETKEKALRMLQRIIKINFQQNNRLPENINLPDEYWECFRKFLDNSDSAVA